jgi:hypothetical protein
VIAALVGGGILSSRLFPTEPAAVEPSALAEASAAASPAEAQPAGTPIPIPSAPLTPRITAAPVDVAALVAAIPRHGTGPLAFVQGRLHSSSRPCDPGSPLSACLTLSIDGLRGATVVPDDTMPVWPGDPIRGETLVLLPRDGQLVYLGSLLVDALGIPRIDVLTATTENAAAIPGGIGPSLYEADGALVSGAPSCPTGIACDPGGSILLAIPPSGPAYVDYTGEVPVRRVDPSPGNWTLDFSGAEPVRIVPDAFGIPSSAVLTTGPFLVRRRTDPWRGITWDLVAREDQFSILRVVIP